MGLRVELDQTVVHEIDSSSIAGEFRLWKSALARTVGAPDLWEGAEVGVFLCATVLDLGWS